MRYPIGEVVHERVPSQLMKADEVVAWMLKERFNGTLIGESKNGRTEVLITDGRLRDAVHIQGQDTITTKKALEFLSRESSEGDLFFSLYRLSPLVCKPLLLHLLVKPNITEFKTQIVGLVGLMELCMKPKLISHIMLDSEEGEGHLLFSDGVLLGSYTGRNLNLDPEFGDFYLLYQRTKGNIHFTRMTEEEFTKLTLPEINLEKQKSDVQLLLEMLVTFLNFTRNAYSKNGLPPQATTSLFAQVTGKREDTPVIIVNDEFKAAPENGEDAEEIITRFVSLLEEVHERLKDMWGPKVVSSRYRRIYGDFLKAFKADKQVQEMLASIAPERIGL